MSYYLLITKRVVPKPENRRLSELPYYIPVSRTPSLSMKY